MEGSQDKQREQPEGFKGKITSEEMIQKLRRALQRDGDFPASAKIVGELKQLTSDPKIAANQVTEVILREPSLGIRVLHLVNSSFYRRAKPIMTVSQAVIQVGMRPLAEMCSSLVLLQKFIPSARRGGSFANCLRKTVVTSLLTSSIAPGATGHQRTSKNEEFGYLAGSFAELGSLLLAFYFPQIYDAAVRRSEVKQQDIPQSIKEITGLSPLRLSLEVLDALQLPEFYKQILSECDRINTNGESGSQIGASDEATRVAKAVCAAKEISEVIVSNRGKQDLDTAIRNAQSRYGIQAQTLNQVIGELPKVFKDHCDAIDLQLPSLPEYVLSYSDSKIAETQAPSSSGSDDEQRFNQFVNEIRQAVENREPTASIITTVMETFAWSLKFDRVFLMLVGSSKTKLVGRMLLGNVPNFDPKKFERVLSADTSRKPECIAFKQARPVYNGDPIFERGWPLAVIPIGFGPRAIGIIYADRNQPDAVELLSREQAAIGMLAELLDRSLALQN